MTAMLGISAFYHDSAAALVVDGRVVYRFVNERDWQAPEMRRFFRRLLDVAR